MPGYGMVWQPYLVGAGWDPLHERRLDVVPRGWICLDFQFYPWGWTPYRYGSWTYLPDLWLVLATGRNVDGLNAGGYDREPLRRRFSRPARRPCRDKRCWSTGGAPSGRCNPRAGRK